MGSKKKKIGITGPRLGLRCTWCCCCWPWPWLEGLAGGVARVGAARAGIIAVGHAAGRTPARRKKKGKERGPRPSASAKHFFSRPPTAALGKRPLRSFPKAPCCRPITYSRRAALDGDDGADSAPGTWTCTSRARRVRVRLPIMVAAAGKYRIVTSAPTVSVGVRLCAMLAICEGKMEACARAHEDVV